MYLCFAEQRLVGEVNIQGTNNRREQQGAHIQEISRHPSVIHVSPIVILNTLFSAASRLSILIPHGPNSFMATMAERPLSLQDRKVSLWRFAISPLFLVQSRGHRCCDGSLRLLFVSRRRKRGAEEGTWWDGVVLLVGSYYYAH